MNKPNVTEGLPHPLGATWDGEGVNFALFSAHATRVEVCLFDEQGRGDRADRAARIHRPDLARLSARGRARERSTAIGCMGPMSLKRATASTPTSCCSIPTRVAHIGELKWDPAVFGYQMESGDDITFDERDSAPFMPKCVVVDPNFDWHGEMPSEPRRAVGRHDSFMSARARLHQAAIPRCRKHLRGTYAGLGSKEVVEYIKSAGRNLGRAAAGPYSSSTTATCWKAA